MEPVSVISPKLDRQPRSKVLRPVDDRQMPLVEKAEPVAVPLELVLKQRSFSAAIALCVQVSGKDEKEVYLPLGIDPGHWTRILQGHAHFPVDKLGALMDLCGNEAPLIWLANSRGYELRKLETALERENRLLRERLAKSEERAQYAENLLVRRSL